MKNAERYLSALCGLYTEVAAIDLEKGTCRLLSAGSSNALFRNTETFTAPYLDALAEQHILPEDRKAFCQFFHSENLRSVWRSGTPRGFCFSRISGGESQPILASIVPATEYNVLCALRFVEHSCKAEPEISYSLFLHQFMQILEKLFDVIIELDMETERARVLRTADYGDIGKTEFDWTDFLAFCQTEGVHGEDQAILGGLLSMEALRKFADSSARHQSTEARLIRNGVYIWVNFEIFCIQISGKTRLLITLHDIDQKKLLQSIVERYVYKNCDYFIYLDANKNTYIMFGGSNSGTPLPPVVCEDYATEVVKYAQDFVAPEDVEMTIREMQLDRVIEQLEKHGEHSFNVGIMDPVKGYTYKRLQYIYYDRLNKMILLTRTDITDVYEEEKKLKKARREAQTDSLTGIYNHKTSLRLIEEQLQAHPNVPAALLFIDLDNFKQVNDHLGHQRGDDLLCSIGEQFQGALRPTDILGRIGGDEFIAFLPAMKGIEPIKRCAERFQALFTALLDDPLRSCGVSCSIGVARYPEDGTACATLLRKADAALYFSKRSGKNQVTFANQLVNEDFSDFIK